MSRTRSAHGPLGGRHELGQNFLIDTTVIAAITDLVGRTDGPILELCAGDGALTRSLATLDRELLAIELDPRRLDELRSRLPAVEVRQADALRVPLQRPVVVGNLPFHLTTAFLRRLLGSGEWQHALLLVQWEVARKRAGVGGATMLTAQAGPWFEFVLHRRVAARAFRPVPTVDGGLLGIVRRSRSLLPIRERAGYRHFVRTAFTGPGRGIGQIIRPVLGRRTRSALRAADVDPGVLPRDLTVAQWVALWRAR